MISTLGKLWECFGQKSIFRFRVRRPCSTPQPLQHVPASRIYLILYNTCIYCYFRHSLRVLCVCTYLIIIGVLLHFNYHYLTKRPAWSLFCVFVVNFVLVFCDYNGFFCGLCLLLWGVGCGEKWGWERVEAS